MEVFEQIPFSFGIVNFEFVIYFGLFLNFLIEKA